MLLEHHNVLYVAPWSWISHSAHICPGAAPAAAASRSAHAHFLVPQRYITILDWLPGQRRDALDRLRVIYFGQDGDSTQPARLAGEAQSLVDVGRLLLDTRNYTNLYIEGLSNLQMTDEDLLYRIEQICMSCARVVFATVPSVGRQAMWITRTRAWEERQHDEALKRAARRGFDACIVDECGQLLEAELCIVAQ
eukprot:scaffold51277_cov17-Tisochrysis_lutea.AAC.1